MPETNPLPCGMTYAVKYDYATPEERSAAVKKHVAVDELIAALRPFDALVELLICRRHEPRSTCDYRLDANDLYAVRAALEKAGVKNA